MNFSSRAINKGLSGARGGATIVDPGGYGLGASVNNSPQQAVTGQPPESSAPGTTPAPGVTGVTPGAVERRLSPTASAQASMGSAGGPPQMGPNAMFSQGQFASQRPNLQGPGRGELNAPMGNLENFLRNIQNRRSQER